MYSTMYIYIYTYYNTRYQSLSYVYYFYNYVFTHTHIYIYTAMYIYIVHIINHCHVYLCTASAKVEAAACGLMVVSTNVGGVPEVLPLGTRRGRFPDGKFAGHGFSMGVCHQRWFEGVKTADFQFLEFEVSQNSLMGGMTGTTFIWEGKGIFSL